MAHSPWASSNPIRGVYPYGSSQEGLEEEGEEEGHTQEGPPQEAIRPDRPSSEGPRTPAGGCVGRGFLFRNGDLVSSPTRNPSGFSRIRIGTHHRRRLHREGSESLPSRADGIDPDQAAEEGRARARSLRR